MTIASIGWSGKRLRTHVNLGIVIRSWPTIIGWSIATFTASNVDDILLVTLLFANEVRTSRIVAGQYLGFAAIVLLSVLGALTALTVPHRWLRLLGLLPLAIGIKQLSTMDKSNRLKNAEPNILSIALVTFTSGGDNIGIYIPFFTIHRAYLFVILFVYAVLVSVLCFIGSWLGRHSLVLRAVRRTSRWIVPGVFIALGIYILVAT